MINYKYFLYSLVIGIFIAYIFQKKKRVIYVYPTPENINIIQLGTDFYHTGEVLSLMLFYQLIHGSGKECPSISKKINEPSFDRLVGTKK